MALTAGVRPMERASSSITSWSMSVESMSKRARRKRGVEGDGSGREGGRRSMISSLLWVASKVAISGVAGICEEMVVQVFIGGMGSLGRSWRV